MIKISEEWFTLKAGQARDHLAIKLNLQETVCARELVYLSYVMKLVV